jgi:hypothetical protein
MHVAFYKVDDGRLCAWRATPARRREFQGTTMASGRDLPHDLAQLVVEAALRLRGGFWGLLASGASFASVPGRRRTRPGRALVREHRAELDVAEGLAISHVTAWREGRATPAAAALDAMLARWRALAVGTQLYVDWALPRLPRADRH